MANPASPAIVILDRDGVINEDSDDYIKSPDEWIPVPGSMEAIAHLTGAGYRIAVATNQSGLGRGLFDEITLANIHNLLLDTVESHGGLIETICFCPHLPDAGCKCRKPGTGLLEQISTALESDLDGAWFVGDSLKDIHAARAYRCRPLLVRSGKGRDTEAHLTSGDGAGLPVLDDLAAAADYIISNDARAENGG